MSSLSNPSTPSIPAMQDARARFVITKRQSWFALACIASIAVVLRIVSSLVQGQSVDPLPGVFDQISYHELAQRVLTGHGFSFAENHWPATLGNEPTAHWSFLYTLYLSGVYALFGVNPLAARIIQAILTGVLQVWLAWRIGKRIFDPVTGLLAAAFSAVYIYFWYYAGALVTESMFIVAILWVFDVATRIGLPGKDAAISAQDNRYALWLELGAAIGVAALFRQLFLLFVPFLFLWLFVQKRGRRTGLASATQPARAASLSFSQLAFRTLACVFVVGLLILPWTIRNYRVFRTFVPLNTNAGYVLFWGNHPIHGTDFIPILSGENGEYGALIPPELLSLDEARLDQALLRLGVGFIVDDSVRFVQLSFSRIGEYFKFWPSNDSGTLSNVSRVGSFGLFLPFMLYGVILAAYRSYIKGNLAIRSGVSLLLLFVIVYSGIHLLTWTLVRYRLPVDSVLLLFAAYAMNDLLYRLGAGIAVQEPQPAH